MQSNSSWVSWMLGESVPWASESNASQWMARAFEMSCDFGGFALVHLSLPNLGRCAKNPWNGSPKITDLCGCFLSVCEYKHLWDTKGMRPSQKSAQYWDVLDQKVMWGISCLWWLYLSKSQELHQFHGRRPSLSQQKASDIHLPIWVCQNRKGVNPPWTNLFLLHYDVMVLKVFLHDGIIPARDAHTKPK